MNDEKKIPEWAPALEDLKLRSRVRWNESLKRFNTWRIGGPSRGLVDVETEEDLARLLPFLNKNDSSTKDECKLILPFQGLIFDNGSIHTLMNHYPKDQ